MLAVVLDMPMGETQPAEQVRITTTLFDLIATLNEAVEPGEEAIVTAAVVHLCNSGRLRFLGLPIDCEVDCD